MAWTLGTVGEFHWVSGGVVGVMPDAPDPDDIVLHQVMETGLLHIRKAARDQDLDAVLVLTDLLHNLPGVLTGVHRLHEWLDVDMAEALDEHGEVEGVRSIAFLAVGLRRDEP